jgi:hypothetical protein
LAIQALETSWISGTILAARDRVAAVMLWDTARWFRALTDDGWAIPQSMYPSQSERTRSPSGALFTKPFRMAPAMLCFRWRYNSLRRASLVAK